MELILKVVCILIGAMFGEIVLCIVRVASNSDIEKSRKTDKIEGIIHEIR